MMTVLEQAELTADNLRDLWSEIRALHEEAQRLATGLSMLFDQVDDSYETAQQTVEAVYEYEDRGGDHHDPLPPP